MTERSHRRKLGQNYLIDPVILFEIEQAINPQKNNLFFEIGPGTGALTEKLLRENIKIIAMDIDKKNIDLLNKKYSSSEYEFIHGDVLKETLKFLSKDKYRIVGNLPYNISTQIIIKLLQYFNMIEDMHFLVQKEVANRICASHLSADWGKLGVKISAFFQTDILFDVPPESFDIKPKVQSSFVRLIPRSAPYISKNEFRGGSPEPQSGLQKRLKTILFYKKKHNVNYEYFDEIMLKMKQEIKKWDGNFYFVYLPSWTRYNNKYSIANYFQKSKIKKIVEDRNIVFVDIDNYFKSKNVNNLEIFIFGIYGHYTKSGYELIAENFINIVSNKP